ncbi:FAR1-related sequence 2 [Rhynchospora pubera]|uniref:FAR1-related sequence 2 n=1 Tax=Rhynchospora pubera TaxID=906938 RepID=A0AAV8HKE2_9POAL|nr:FAR1-related sequence 2 [Rhynchospora pubera]
MNNLLMLFQKNQLLEKKHWLNRNHLLLLLLHSPTCNSLPMKACFTYYLRYAFEEGFGIMKNGGASKDCKDRCIFTCTRGGKSRGKSNKAITERNKMIVKTGCKAALYLKLNSSTNKWVITEFIDEHNHQLLPEYVHKISCFRQLKEWAKKQLELNDSSGVYVVANINAVTQMGGGPEHCGFTERDCRNYLAKLRRGNFRKGDAAALMQQFRLKKQKDPNFYYSYKFDTENRLEIVFWADSVSRSWYDLPVAPFVGVNHHGFSIIFGCAMMTHESAESYKWIINCFLECMGSKAPESIITDQSLSMKKAIEETLSDTTHRHCTWHILNKLNSKIGNNELAASDIKNVIYKSKTEAEFEMRWQSTIRKHYLEDNDWLVEMFDIRKSWIPAYLHDHFWAGMISTQRSESINSFLDNYVNSKTTLRDFGTCFDRALSRLRKREYDKDFECKRGTSRLISQYNTIEQQFADVYIREMFVKFQHEIKALIDSRFTMCESVGNIKVYNVDDGEGEFKVNFNCDDHTFECECHLFETKGLVCRHALLVYKQECVTHIPSKYILDRWSKSYKRNYMDTKSIAISVRERRESQNNLHLLMYLVFLKLMDYATLDEEMQDKREQSKV